VLLLLLLLLLLLSFRVQCMDGAFEPNTVRQQQ
jgi:hypothetical protein